MATEDKNLIFIGSDLGFKVLADFARELPEQFYMEGISEANIIGMSAGLAMNGKTVFVNTIASFLTRRCYEQIAINLCLENLKVRLFANGGGLIYGPMGPTHTVIEDLALMSSLPHMAVIVPCDKKQMVELLEQTTDYLSPIYFRIARDNYPVITENYRTKFGFPTVLKKGNFFALISIGYMSHIALKVANALSKNGLNIMVIDIHSLRPFEKDDFIDKISSLTHILTMEEHIRYGGLYSVVSDLILSENLPIRICCATLPNQFLEKYGEQDQLLSALGLDVEGITHQANLFFKNDN